MVTLCTTKFNIQQFYVLPTQCIYVFCVDLRTNSDYFPIQHSLTGFYNRDGVCLLRGTDWIFIYNSTFCPHSVFMCFVWIWEQTAIISLYNINWLGFITETGSVYYAVRAGSLIQVVFVFKVFSSCHYHSTHSPYSSSSTRCSYETDKRAIPGNLPKGNSYPETLGTLDSILFHFFFYTILRLACSVVRLT